MKSITDVPTSSTPFKANYSSELNPVTASYPRVWNDVVEE